MESFNPLPGLTPLQLLAKFERGLRTAEFQSPSGANTFATAVAEWHAVELPEFQSPSGANTFATGTAAGPWGRSQGVSIPFRG